jgi:signal transduction histidine kinase
MTGGRRWFGWAALAYVMIIVAVTFGLGRMYNGAHARLDEALGQRLLAVAHTVAEMTDGQALLSHSLGDTTSDYYLETLHEKFAAVARQENLAEITLTNPLDQVVILSTSASLAAGQPNDYWQLDPAAVESAQLGKAAATRLYDLGGTEGLKQKSAYAPIMNYVTDGGYVVAIVTVSGSPDFFEALDDLKMAAWLTGGLVLLVLVLMGVFLSQINLAIGRYRASIQRQENLAAMGRMTAGIAHEIRNPLGIIRGAGEHLQRVLAEQGIADEVADYIPEEVDRLDQILTGYLAFGTDKDAVVEEFDLALGVRRTSHLVRDEFAAAGVQLEIQETMPPALVLGDPRRLQQVVLNLLINARDAMPEGGVVTVSVALKAGQVQVVVTDDGPGLGTADVGKLFEPFWTSKEKGSGLGLAMSRKIMEDMGGRLTLRDRSDRSGAVAELWAPLVPANKP